MPHTPHITSHWLYQIYTLCLYIIAPVVMAVDYIRMGCKHIAHARRMERFGFSYRQKRPQNKRLLWINAVSLGEARIALMLAKDITNADDDVAVLITTTTQTGANIVTDTAPGNVYHAYAPVDLVGPVDRFLKYWHPEAGVFTESDLWPRLIFESDNKSIPLAIVNARLSRRSLGRWGKFPHLAKALLGVFSCILTQTDTMRDRLISLGAPAKRITTLGDLKTLADVLDFDPHALNDAQADFGQTPRWVAASTHTGEDILMAQIHEKVCHTLPEAKLILVPRHPERGKDIAQILHFHGYKTTRRSLSDPADAPIYIADTLGELGLWYRLSSTAVICGSFCPHTGGHNPYEAVNLGCYVISGTGIDNFTDAYKNLCGQNRASITNNSDKIAQDIIKHISNAGAPAPDTDTAQKRHFVTQMLLALISSGNHGNMGGFKHDTA